MLHCPFTVHLNPLDSQPKASLLKVDEPLDIKIKLTTSIARSIAAPIIAAITRIPLSIAPNTKSGHTDLTDMLKIFNTNKCKNPIIIKQVVSMPEVVLMSLCSILAIFNYFIIMRFL